MAGDFTDLAECEVELKSLEGANGTVWRYFEALRSLEGERNSRKSDGRDAARLLSEIEALRPNCGQSRTPVCTLPPGAKFQPTPESVDAKKPALV